jgi:U3 small nucleolar RNA-associated protein 14
MPGRQSTLQSSRPTSRRTRKPNRRAIDALAIAERQNPTRVKIQRHRLGEDVHDDITRRRGGEGSSGSEEPTGSDFSPAKRRKTATSDTRGDVSTDEGSDSDGNHWRLGAVDSDDDSELDSDEAMGESDEERYKDYAFHGSAKPRPGSKVLKPGHEPYDPDVSSRVIDLSEGDEGLGALSDDEEDDLGGDAVDLATALDMNEEEEVEYARELAAAKTRDKQRPVEEERGYDDEDSDDSREALSNDDDEGMNSSGLAKLQEFISSIHKGSEKSSDARQRYSNNAQEQKDPSEFGVRLTQKLSVADLISSVTDPRMKNSLKMLKSAEKPLSSKPQGGIPGKLAAPLPKRLQDKLNRDAAYEKSKETLGRWIETVKHNRRTEHLSFPLVDQDALAIHGTKRLLPTSSSKPLNELEETIQVLLEESGLKTRDGADEEARLQASEELQSNQLPIEEAQARRAELRRARDLLFREEVRSRRIKKIKSKSYRRVHRKERQRMEKQEREALAAAGAELSEDEQELYDRRRAEERMGARHRASRWAKGVKETGRATWDEDARGGVTEMARKGYELRRRIDGKRAPNPSDDYLRPSSSDSEDQMSDVGDPTAGNKARHERQLHRAASVVDSTTESGIMSMKFMKNAEAARRAANDADIDRLRRELNGEEPSEEEAEEVGRRRYGRQVVSSLEQKPNPKASEFEETLDASNRNMDEAVENEDVRDNTIVRGSTTSKKLSTSTSTPGGAVIEKETNRNSTSSDTQLNPWLSSQPRSARKPKKPPASNDAPIIVANPEPTPHPSHPSRPSNRLSKDTPAEGPVMPPSHLSSSSPDPPTIVPSSSQHHNAELVKAAFAGDDVFASFEAEKASLAASEDEKEVAGILPGWGSWTGEGISKKQPKRQQSNPLNQRNLTKIPGVKPSDRKDATLVNVTISEKHVRKNGRYLASQLPHPFESRAQYERSLRVPVGPEWTTKETFQSGTKPRVMVKKGVVVGAMERPLL